MIEKVIISSLVCLAVHVALKPGMVFAVLGEIIDLFTGVFAKPLGLCLPCMSSVYGTLLFIFWADLPAADFIPYILAVTGVNYILSMAVTIYEIFTAAQHEQDYYERGIHDN